MNPLRRSRRRSLPPPERSEDLVLADGRSIRLRPVDPRDAEPIAGGFELLNEEEVRRRYLHPVRGLSADHLHRLVNPAPGEDFVLVAAEPLPPGEALIGAVARLSRDPGTDQAEFAILVSHFLAGQGLGRQMMERLLEWARARGLRRLWGDVVDDNTPMLALAKRLGFQHESVLGSPGVQRVTLDLTPS